MDEMESPPAKSLKQTAVQGELSEIFQTPGFEDEGNELENKTFEKTKKNSSSSQRKPSLKDRIAIYKRNASLTRVGEKSTSSSELRQNERETVSTEKIGWQQRDEAKSGAIRRNLKSVHQKPITVKRAATEKSLEKNRMENKRREKMKRASELISMRKKKLMSASSKPLELHRICSVPLQLRENIMNRHKRNLSVAGNMGHSSVTKQHYIPGLRDESARELGISQGIVFDTDKDVKISVVRAGWLHKAGGGNFSAAYKKRYCVLEENGLLKYFADEEQKNRRGKGDVYFKNNLKIDHQGVKFTIKSEGRKWEFKADNFIEAERWCEAFRKVSTRNSLI